MTSFPHNVNRQCLCKRSKSHQIITFESTFSVSSNHIIFLSVFCCAENEKLGVVLGSLKYYILKKKHNVLLLHFLSSMIPCCGKNYYSEDAIIIFSTMKHTVYCFCCLPYAMTILHFLLSLNLFYCLISFPSRKYYMYTHSQGRQGDLEDII